MSGRTIRIYLTDGTANGILTAEIINWTGKVIVVPRTQLQDLASRAETQRTGVYILAGQDLDTPLKDQIYVGESDKVLTRLGQHSANPDRDFWTRTAIITSKDQNLTKAHVRYLESRLIQLGCEAQRATITNGNTPPPPSLPESDIADMEYFLGQLQTILPVLGFTFAMPIPTLAPIQVPTLPPVSGLSPSATNGPVFVMTSGDACAEARQINGEFVVLGGSTVRKEAQDSIRERDRELRTQLIKEGKLVAHPTNADVWCLTSDLPLTSPTGAAKLIAGVSLNGMLVWKLKGTTQTYGEWQQAQITTATASIHGDDG